MVHSCEGVAPLTLAAAQNDVHLLRGKIQIGKYSGALFHFILALGRGVREHRSMWMEVKEGPGGGGSQTFFFCLCLGCVPSCCSTAEAVRRSGAEVET